MQHLVFVTKIAVLILAIYRLFLPCSSLTCHVCIGGQSSPCYTDGKSTQVLDCSKSELMKPALLWYRYMYDLETPQGNNCIAVTYNYLGTGEGNREREAMRTCFPNL
ncbi:hypothetical protein QE152_g34460 [Popillia japonica]|uniref:Secreted protein n=1 Tax=Popillia japonica TaxID=7064 RepID=A0AAW1ITN7_POPJA